MSIRLPVFRFTVTGLSDIFDHHGGSEFYGTVWEMEAKSQAQRPGVASHERFVFHSIIMDTRAETAEQAKEDIKLSVAQMGMHTIIDIQLHEEIEEGWYKPVLPRIINEQAVGEQPER